MPEPKVSSSLGVPGRKPNPQRPTIRTTNSLVQIEATLDSTMQGPGHLPTPQSDISPNASHTPTLPSPDPLEPSELSCSPSTFDGPVMASVFTTHGYSHLCKFRLSAISKSFSGETFLGNLYQTQNWGLCLIPPFPSALNSSRCHTALSEALRVKPLSRGAKVYPFFSLFISPSKVVRLGLLMLPAFSLES